MSRSSKREKHKKQVASKTVNSLNRMIIGSSMSDEKKAFMLDEALTNYNATNPFLSQYNTTTHNPYDVPLQVDFMRGYSTSASAVKAEKKEHEKLKDGKEGQGVNRKEKKERKSKKLSR